MNRAPTEAVARNMVSPDRQLPETEAPVGAPGA
jgi:hypothetical protein